MKFVSIVLLLGLVFVTSFGFTSEQNSTILVKGVDITTWPKVISSDSVLDIYIEMMASDSNAQLLLDRVNRKLNLHGIKYLRDIFNYCKSDDRHQMGGLSQKTAVIGARFSIPGIEKEPWEDAVLEEQRKGFISKVIETNFVEYMAVSERPEICITVRDRLYLGYSSLIHEMHHFLYLDTFYYLEHIVSSHPFPDYLRQVVFRQGGEWDANVAAGNALMKMVKKYGLENKPLPPYSKYFTLEGDLADPEGLKKHLLKEYEDYADEKAIQENYKTKLSAVSFKLEILKSIPESEIKSINRPALEKRLSEEIKSLEILKSEIASEIKK